MISISSSHFAMKSGEFLVKGHRMDFVSVIRLEKELVKSDQLKTFKMQEVRHSAFARNQIFYGSNQELFLEVS